MPGEAGIWVFIFGDMLVFGLFFVTYLHYRGGDTSLYVEAQRELNQTLGLINTLLLLTSSWCVAQAVTAIRRGRVSVAPKLFAAGFALGLGFVVVKLVEYGEKISAGITLLTNDFFMFFFMFTGIHMLHVLIGLGVLGFLFSLSRREAAVEHVQSLESGGAFWHLVDLLWIVLFALFYLVK
jgi:nitric oxide reductase NorE protein